ncbi:MAG: DUF3473 domain-containing protein [candidate division Zixibacteria bacterium]|nr:DUF3473 domain-containing protein [candidate division Zixibacteria bacterium]
MVQSADLQHKTTTRAFAGHILAIEINDFLPNGFSSSKSRSRVIPNILHLIDHIDKYRAEANFYITPDLMKDFPEIISLVSSRGHEIGLCCDYRCFKCPADISAYKKELENFTKQQAFGFMLKSQSQYGREILKSLAGSDFQYCLTDFNIASRDNIILPIEMKYSENMRISAFPPSYYKFLGIDIEFGQPSKMRLYPYWFLRKCIRHFTYIDTPAIINFPLWEFDPHLPRQVLSPIQGLRSYGNLSLAEYKLTRLLLEFDFARIPKIMGLEDTDNN